MERCSSLRKSPAYAEIHYITRRDGPSSLRSWNRAHPHRTADNCHVYMAQRRFSCLPALCWSIGAKQKTLTLCLLSYKCLWPCPMYFPWSFLAFWDSLAETVSSSMMVVNADPSTEQHTIVVVCIISSIASSISVVIRLWTRIFVTHSVAWNDCKRPRLSPWRLYSHTL